MSMVAALKTTDPGRFGKVGLFVGGNSAERDVSLDGGRAVLAAMQRKHIQTEMFDGSAGLFEAISAGRVDRVFNLVHGPGGEDGAIQGALQLMDIPVTGAGLLGSALSMDKVHSKWVWERQGICTPPFRLTKYASTDRGGQASAGPFDELFDEWGLPLFVKPAGLGSSIGISKVERAGDMPAAIALAHDYSETVIVEPEVKGREFFAGIIGDLVLPLIRIETPRDFYDYTAKYEADDTQYFCPGGVPQDVEKRLQVLSLEAFRALDCSGWGRVDFILDENGKAWFLEVNTTPGMTSHSLVPQAAVQIGIGFDELVWRILESSL
ncbi:MAG: D-alanine--D-alanine ligase [Gammaproteobacteria bacterium]|nr:MAG: D-alanine--D-alanine ligase [Gammaproteobacteria bacterium]